MKKLILTGPESTGKTTIANFLSAQLDIEFIEEFAREYLNQTQGKYDYDDLEKMAKKSMFILDQKRYDKLILDTDLLTYKIWSEVRYNKVSTWIVEHLEMNKSGLYFLCYPDLEWVSDPLRENPGERHFLFKLYEDLLIQLECNYFIITGSKKVRLKTALDLASDYFLL